MCRGRHRGPPGGSLITSGTLLPRLGHMSAQHERWARRSAVAGLLIAGLTVAAIGGRPGRERFGLDVTGTLMTTSAVVLIAFLSVRRVVTRRMRRRGAAGRGLPGEDVLARTALEVAVHNSCRIGAIEDDIGEFFASMGGDAPGPRARAPWPGFQVIRGGRDSGHRPAS
jgi:hypothetical protein